MQKCTTCTVHLVQFYHNKCTATLHCEATLLKYPERAHAGTQAAKVPAPCALTYNRQIDRHTKMEIIFSCGKTNWVSVLPHKNRFHFIKSTLKSLGRYFPTIFMIVLFFRRFVFCFFVAQFLGRTYVECLYVCAEC